LGRPRSALILERRSDGVQGRVRRPPDRSIPGSLPSSARCCPFLIGSLGRDRAPPSGVARRPASEVRARIWRTDTLAPPRKAGASSPPARTTAFRPMQERKRHPAMRLHARERGSEGHLAYQARISPGDGASSELFEASGVPARSTTSSSASTTRGSNCEPAFETSSVSATSRERARR
jgi:hypothetical protein